MEIFTLFIVTVARQCRETTSPLLILRRGILG